MVNVGTVNIPYMERMGWIMIVDKSILQMDVVTPS